MKSSVSVLLTRCLDDTDDEVRDRAALNLRLMAEEDEMADIFIKNGKPLVFTTDFQPVFIIYLSFTDGTRIDVLAFDLRAPTCYVCDIWR